MSALSELTDNSAVAVSVQEFKDLGRDAFLEKYGLHPSVRYFADIDGLHVDSKPLPLPQLPCAVRWTRAFRGT